MSLFKKSSISFDNRYNSFLICSKLRYHTHCKWKTNKVFFEKYKTKLTRIIMYLCFLSRNFFINSSNDIYLRLYITDWPKIIKDTFLIEIIRDQKLVWWLYNSRSCSGICLRINSLVAFHSSLRTSFSKNEQLLNSLYLQYEKLYKKLRTLCI